ncbi:MAG: hypothetical protein HRT69_08260 [Flavobacteriaceae bacterium]|nr:hypothetical protein [Flavobacteriaceae bacterium]
MSLLLGIGYMWILLGTVGETSSTGFLHLLNLMSNLVLVYVGLIGGSVIALLFILINIFYLKKKLKSNMKSTIIRFFILLVIAIVVGVTHYILEKIVDVI